MTAKAGEIETRVETLQLGSREWQIMCLKDRQQFHDPGGKHEAAGVAPATWPLFGVVWSAGIQLAELMMDEPLEGRSVLELGCGLGLPSLVLASRGVDVLATDLHPLAGRFLAENARQNGLAPVPFEVVDFREPWPGGKRRDVLIGSDLLYEPDQPGHLARFCTRYCETEVVITDPGRKQLGRFSRLMEEAGFEVIIKEPGRFARFRRLTPPSV